MKDRDLLFSKVLITMLTLVGQDILKKLLRFRPTVLKKVSPTNLLPSHHYHLPNL